MTVEPGSVVPVRVTVFSVTTVPETGSVTTGAAGAVPSTSSVISADWLVPSALLALAAKLWGPAASSVADWQVHCARVPGVPVAAAVQRTVSSSVTVTVEPAVAWPVKLTRAEPATWLA
jgi:hypothetical protein